MPIVQCYPTVTPWTPRNDGVYTRQPQRQHATSGVFTSLLARHAKIGMRVKTLFDRRHKNNLRVYTASDANWLNKSFSSWPTTIQHMCNATLHCFYLSTFWHIIRYSYCKEFIISRKASVGLSLISLKSKIPTIAVLSSSFFYCFKCFIYV